MLIRFTVDGAEHRLTAAPDSSLLAVLRDDLGLTATKDACEQGECGACSVRLDGEVVCACLVPAVQLDGRKVDTVGSLANGGLHPLQEAFLDAGAVQCGFCTPGMIIKGVSLLARNPQPDESEIKRNLEGNLCRCTGYMKIIKAVQLAAQRMASKAAE